MRVTGRLATAKSTMSSGRRFFRARTSAYSWTSANVTWGVSSFSMCGLLKTSLARPPRIDASRTLASAASLTASLPPIFEIFQDFLLRDSPALNLARDLSGEHGEEFMLEFDRQRILLQREKHTGQLASPRYQNGVLGAQHARGLVAEFPYCTDT